MINLTANDISSFVASFRIDDGLQERRRSTDCRRVGSSFVDLSHIFFWWNRVSTGRPAGEVSVLQSLGVAGWRNPLRRMQHAGFQPDAIRFVAAVLADGLRRGTDRDGVYGAARGIRPATAQPSSGSICHHSLGILVYED